MEGKIMTHVTKKTPVSCLIITVSDTRTVDNDKSGLLIKELLEKEQHNVIQHVIVPDEKKEIVEIIDQAITDGKIDAILMTGGTGISRRDVTIEVVKNKIDKELNGFGEIFRVLSYTDDIGSPAMMSRAIAGVIDRKVIFAMPGSSGAVKLAMNKLILPELSHIMAELYKDLW